MSASARVRRWYQQEGRLATERAVLDDSGDGIGGDADRPGTDGRLAASLYFGAGVEQPPGRGRSGARAARRPPRGARSGGGGAPDAQGGVAGHGVRAGVGKAAGGACPRVARTAAAGRVRLIPKIMECESCGTEIAANALICFRCGEATGEPEHDAPADPPAGGLWAPVVLGVGLLLALGFFVNLATGQPDDFPGGLAHAGRSRCAVDVAPVTMITYAVGGARCAQGGPPAHVMGLMNSLFGRKQADQGPDPLADLVLEKLKVGYLVDYDLQTCRSPATAATPSPARTAAWRSGSSRRPTTGAIWSWPTAAGRSPGPFRLAPSTATSGGIFSTMTIPPPASCSRARNTTWTPATAGICFPTEKGPANS